MDHLVKADRYKKLWKQMADPMLEVVPVLRVLQWTRSVPSSLLAQLAFALLLPAS